MVLRTVEAGAVVGEISTDGSSRSATVRARTSCLILKVPAPAFRQFAREEPEFLERLFWTQVDRVRSLTREVTRTHQKAITDALTQIGGQFALLVEAYSPKSIIWDFIDVAPKFGIILAILIIPIFF